MKLTRHTVTGVLYAALLLASSSTLALTLGKMRGGAILGKELDVAVAVQHAEDEDVASGCFSADVQYGESRVDASRLSLRTQPGAQSNSLYVRITSSARVDDAVVTVNFKSSCGAKAVRRYVLLADVASELAADPIATTAPVAKRVEEAVAAKASVGGNAAVAEAQSTTSNQLPAAKPAAPKSVARNKLPATPPVVKKPDAAPKVQAPVDTEAMVALQRRVDDIEKWQAQSTAADEVLKSQERAKALESDLQGLKAVTAKNQQNLQTVATALEASESQSYGRSLLYALVALLVACVGAVGYVLTRVRAGGAVAAPWWSTGEQVAEAAAAPASSRDELPSRFPLSSATPATPLSAAAEPPKAAASIEEPKGGVPSVSSVDLDIEVAPASQPAPMPVAPVPAVAASGPISGHADFSNSVQGQLRAINTQEMLDIRQQAEFFMALGQHDDAVHLLEGSIQNSEDANPLVFLDLLKIFHTLSRREDFERYREEFNRHFTGRVPPYAEFLAEGNGLDAYEDICQQIVVLWPSEYTIDFIEQCLVRTPEDDPEQGIDLEAFKDLLLLYGILKRLDQTTDSAFIPFSTSRTFNTPTAPELPVASAAPVAAMAVENSSQPLPVLPTEGGDVAAIDLDLDLSEAEASPAQADAAHQGNLIDFDVSGFIKPVADKSPK